MLRNFAPAALACALAAFAAAVASPATAAVLLNHDIVIADPGRRLVARVNPATGAETVISSGGYFDGPNDVVVDPARKFAYVTDFSANAIIKVDVATGAQTLFTGFHGPAFIDFDRGGKLLVTEDGFNDGRLLRVDPQTGASTVVATNLIRPRGFALADDGSIFVISFPTTALLKVNPVTGTSTTISQGGMLSSDFDVLIGPNGDLIVVNEYGPNIVRVNPATGDQSVIAEGSPFITTTAGDWDSDGTLVVADVGQLAMGGVRRVNVTTGAVSVISNGGYPAGVDVIVPEPASAAGAVVAVGWLVGGRRRRSLRRVN